MTDRHPGTGADADDVSTPDVGTPRRAALTFAGQAGAWLDELHALWTASPAARRIIDLTATRLAELAARPEFATSGRWARGIDVRPWFEGPRPDAAYQASCAVSHPWIFAAQIARWLTVRDDVLAHAEVVALTGHSQGVIAATLLAERTDLSVPDDRYLNWLDWICFEGLRMDLAFRRDAGTPHPEATPMGAVGRLPRTRLQAVIDAVNAELPEDRRMAISLENTWDRTVVSGPPTSLLRLRERLDARKREDASDRRTPDPMPSYTWEWLGVSTPFHSPYMAPGMAHMRADLASVGFHADVGLAYDVRDPANGESLLGQDDLVTPLLRSLFVEPVRWQRTVRSLSAIDGLTHVIDLGPGDGVARLTASAIRGTGIAVVAGSTESGRAHLAEGTLPAAEDWRRFAPTLVKTPSGAPVIDNAWTRATGTPPVFLPGMTPTTVEVPIVAAAADAGFMAELAGGGQVTERHLRMRLEELADTLQPGGRVVFNALYLDAYLWRLHLGEKKLVQKLAAAGAPLCGVTVSAGIPPVDEAAALLDELEDVGLWLNAFKPGTAKQVDQVLAIAAARPERPLFLHLEGGHAGGHHGWQGLEPLLLATYARIRRQPNVVLCVGGGVGDEARSTALLTGAWSEAHGLARMPVDAVFLGTATMACREAMTSPDVKRALVEAAGADGWVRTGEFDGAVTSGRSGLDADIHYLDTSAARAARLLDEVAGDAEAVAARRDELVDALSRTSKPYFGDVRAMTWAAFLTRLAELMAIGRGGRYEDGAWLDVTWRQRFADALARAEARVADADEGTFESRIADVDLQDPAACVDALCAAWPAAATHTLHPMDEIWFLDVLCRRPGKPVPFVPVLDANVRKWFSSDALWQAHDDRYTADQVLVIPGPVAVSGIREADEPIGVLLGRFVAHLAEAVEEPPTLVERRPRSYAHSARADLEPTRNGYNVQVLADGAAWGDALAGLPGRVATALIARDGWTAGQRVANPVARLCAPLDGARLELRDGGDRGTWALGDERVDLAWADDALEVTVHPRLAGAAATWTFRATLADDAVVVDPDATIPGFYQRALFGEALPSVPLFASSTETVTVDPAQAAAYARVTGRLHDTDVPQDLVFTLAWRPMFTVLSALPEGLLRLVHLSHAVEVGPGGLPAAGDRVAVAARVTRVEDGPKGRTIHAEATLDGGERATLRATFFVRGDFGRTDWSVRALETVERTFEADDAVWQVLADHRAIIRVDGGRWTVDGPVRVAVELEERRRRDGTAICRATGTLSAGDVLATVVLDEETAAPHAVRALLDRIAPETDDTVSTPAKTLATASDVAPVDPAVFARVGGDHNPIHVSPTLARFADLGEPIVHGLWSAARCSAFVVDRLADGDAGRVLRSEVSFLSPVTPGATLELVAVRRGVSHGARHVEVTLSAEGTPAVRGTWVIGPATVAYVFPGQGIQRPGMGMDGLGRSRAARRVWETADRVTRERMGYSLLRVVRENPTQLWLPDGPVRHPEGVLNLTQFTQVAMAALAIAQVAELDEAGVLVEDALFCGHSVGEYAALAAYGRVLPLEAVIELVWQRGLTMHGLVARDADGESGYRMGVIRPHYAGLAADQVDALVDEVRAKTGSFLEIVNYNVAGRQYAVTGRQDALDALAKELEARQSGRKACWLLVPGIDVPFHSSALVPGVDAFRDALERWLPETVDTERLAGRYVPNLVARVFELTPAFAASILDVVDSPVVRDVVDRWDDLMVDPDRLARTLVVELLAWQFASPVRWIETQALLIQPTWNDGLGVEGIVEIGVGYQPTLSNMAKQTRKALDVPVPVHNVEADRELVYQRDGDAPARRAAPTTRKPAAAAPAAPAAVAAPTPSAVPASNEPPPDVTPSVAAVLHWVLALQAKRRVDQLSKTETLEEVFDGVSSRVNQVLLDLGAELGVGAVDGAGQMSLGELAAKLESQSRYRAPGPYRTARHDAACAQALGPAGWSRRDLEGHLTSKFQFGPGLVAEALDLLVLGTREGNSTRGGELGTLPAQVSDVTEAKALARKLAEELAGKHGFGLPGDGVAAAGVAVDAEALNALRDELLGPDGVLTRTAAALGRTSLPEATLPEPAGPAPVLDPEVERALQPAFDANKHVALTSGWAWAHRDVVTFATTGEGDGERLIAWGGDTPVGRTAAWYADRLRASAPAVLDTLDRIAAGGARPPVSWTPVRPGPAGDLPDGTRRGFVDALTPRDAGVLATDWRPLLEAGATEAWSFAGRTALVTGAGPTSLATAVVRHLLRGGARVVVTTSSYRRDRVDLYRQLFADNAGPGAELHVVPFNQGSLVDVDALIAWLGASDLLPDLLLPFAAIKDLATLDALGPRSEIALRAMLLGPEKLIGGLAARFRTLGRGDRLQVLVPLSPNLGTFGGDGVYGETKAALETLAAKWHSEHAAWGRHTALVPVRIGWVRGTALMDGNDSAAYHLEEATNARTFSSDEMGFLLAALCTDDVRARAAQGPLKVDLTAGLGDLPDLARTMDGIRADLRAAAERAARVADLGDRPTPPTVRDALPSWPPVQLPGTPPTTAAAPSTVHRPPSTLRDTVVICGFGEVGPWGSARTRWAREVDPRLPAAAVLELAWITGLVTFEKGKWVDAETGDEVPEHALADRYRDAVSTRSGVRFVDPEATGYDPTGFEELATAWLDRDFTFAVASAEEARAFQRADPTHTKVHNVDGQWKVTRTAGAAVRVPRQASIKRTVAGQVPTGWDPTRYGVPTEMADRIDKASLFNLVSTVEAFLSAGLTPEELLQKVHPIRVGSTQGSGIGGIESLRKLYVDPVLADDRQRDILQETLINVIASYAVQTYVGGYGPVSTPVAACATAAVSVEHACEKILAGKADVVIAGGVDDIGLAGARGFADMGATADSLAMLAKGFEPDEISRSNDARRGGFVEAHGGGAALLVRGDVALELGLPVFGVVAYASTFTDGIHPSVPAPGLGVLGCATGGRDSALGQALASLGLTADDIAVVSKHDTSTAANDPNEAALHDRIQTELGRTPGNPLFVVSQKALTGHAKGGAAAWQLHGLCQMLATGTIPGNRNLHSVDEQLRPHAHLVYSDRTVQLPEAPRAGVLTSLGFGHIGAIVVVANPDVWLARVPEDRRAAWAEAAGARLDRSRRDRWSAMLGEKAMYTKRGDRRLPEGVDEADLLVDPSMRLGADGRFAVQA